jgi:RNA polymerase-binding transcription factor
MSGDLAAVLDQKQAALEAELADLASHAGNQGEISFGKRIGEGTSTAVDRLSLVGSHDRLRAMLADVQRAQRKLADGSYGVCDDCGGSIPGERLAARPWAVLCVSCASTR